MKSPYWKINPYNKIAEELDHTVKVRNFCETNFRELKKNCEIEGVNFHEWPRVFQRE